MPGTIHVSVLDYKGTSSTSSSSSISIKVSMGKREYETWDKGDFSFPLTTLRENLVVTLQDAEGNEISRTGVQAMSVVQKGLWDDIFCLEGGGHVHLKLQFVLSEEERNRIRVMRESALKMHSTVPDSSPRYSETTTAVGGPAASSLSINSEVSGLQTSSIHEVMASHTNVTKEAGPSSNFDSFSKDSHSGSGGEEERLSSPKPMTPNIADRNEETSLTSSMPGGTGLHLVEEHKDTGSSENAAINNSTSSNLEEGKGVKQGPLEKTPSSVRKMITVFESSLVQDIRPQLRSHAAKSTKIKGPLKVQDLKDISKPESLSSGRLNSPFLTGSWEQASISSSGRWECVDSSRDLRVSGPFQAHRQLNKSSAPGIQFKGKDSSSIDKSKVVHKEMNAEEWQKFPQELTRPLTSTTATISGRGWKQHSGVNQHCNLANEQTYSGGTSYTEGKGRRNSSNDSTDIKRASDERLKSTAYWQDQYHGFEGSGAWIYPDETRHICVTTASKKVINLLGGWHIGSKKLQRSKDCLATDIVEKQEIDAELEKQEKQTQKLRTSMPQSPANDASPNQVGKAIKIAIIVGFGIFVLLTRQRQPRKSIAKTEDFWSTNTEYLDQQTLMEEWVDSNQSFPDF